MGIKPEDTIDGFLRILGVEVEQPKKQQQQQQQLPGQPPKGVPVRLMYEHSLGRCPYILHCFVYNPQAIPEQLNKISLEGRLEQWQITFRVESLKRFSEIIEAELEKYEVNFHRSTPLLPSLDHVVVSYELVPRSNDPRGVKVRDEVAYLISRIYTLTRGDLRRSL